MSVYDLNFKDRLLSEFADDPCQKISSWVIRELRGMTDALLSGDSGLENVWEEICAQVQGEQSPFWYAYLTTAEDLALKYVRKLMPHERMAIWWQTEQDNYDEDVEDLTIEDCNMCEVSEYIVQRYVLSIAADDESPNVVKYLENM